MPLLKTILNKIKNMEIERIENSNGTAIKYPDGTMICYGRKSISNVEFSPAGAIYYSATQTITYPAQFIETPSTNISCRTSNTAWAGNIISNNNNCTFNILHSINVTRSVSIEWISIGRWK